MCGAAVHDEFVDGLVGNRRQRCLAVACLPCVPHPLQERCSAHPTMEVGIDGHVHVCSNRESRPCSHGLGVFTRTDEDASGDFLVHSVRCVMHDLGDFRDVRRRQPVDDHAVRLTRTELEHPLSQCSDQDRRLDLGLDAEAKSVDLERVVLLGDLFPGERVMQEAHDVTHLLVGLDEGHAIPALDNHVARRTDADRESPWCGIGHRGDALGDNRCGARVGGHDRGTESKSRLPRGGQCERCECIGAVSLGRPDVRIAPVGELGELVALTVQVSRERDGHAVSSDHRCSLHTRAIQL